MGEQVTAGEGPDRAEGGVRTRPRYTDERGTREATQQRGPAGHGTTGPEPAHVRDDPIGHGAYGAGALDEVTVPLTDPVREAKDRDLDDPADVRVDPAVLRDGGPTRTPGVMTTTGTRTGAAAVRHRAGEPAEAPVAPTTTGDATSGGMSTGGGGATSDATTGTAPRPASDDTPDGQ